MISHASWSDCVIHLKPPAQWNGISSQNTWIVSSATVRTSNPAWYDVTLYFRKALCCWWLRWLTLSLFYWDLLSRRENLDARSQHDDCTGKCGRCSYRQSVVRSWRIFRYRDEFGMPGGEGVIDIDVTWNDGVCCIMFNLSFILCFHCLLSSVDTELLYVLIIFGLATTCWIKLKLLCINHI